MAERPQVYEDGYTHSERILLGQIEQAERRASEAESKLASTEQLAGRLSEEVKVTALKLRRSNEALRDAISCWDDLLEMAASGNGLLLESHAKTMRARMVSWEEALNE